MAEDAGSDSLLIDISLPGLRYHSLGKYENCIGMTNGLSTLDHCTDGGGICGVSILTILQKIMEKIQFFFLTSQNLACLPQKNP